MNFAALPLASVVAVVDDEEGKFGLGRAFVHTHTHETDDKEWTLAGQRENERRDTLRALESISSSVRPLPANAGGQLKCERLY